VVGKELTSLVISSLSVAGRRLKSYDIITYIIVFNVAVCCNSIRLSEKNNKEDDSELRLFSRRSALRFGLMAAALAVVRTDGGPPPHYLPDHLEGLPKKPEKLYSPERYPPITRQRIAQVIQELQRPIESKQMREKAVEGSLRLVRSVDSSSGTAFQVDECGIYLTVSHVVLDNEMHVLRPDLVVNNPETGITNPATHVFLHEAADLAVVYAPTGREPSVTPGLEVDLTAVADNQSLKLVGMWPPRNSRFIDSGHVEPSQPGDPWARVKGMIPYGGTSGSPVVDADSKIRGVLSGFYGSSYEIKDYVGSRVIPLTYSDSLPEYPVQLSVV
jgi:hypothetical protein